MSEFLSFSELNSVSFCVCISLLIYSSVSGHSGCFLLLAILNNVAMNRDIQISLQDSFSYHGYVPGNRIARSYDLLFEYFEESLYCFLQRLPQISFPLRVYRGSDYSTSSPPLIIFWVLWEWFIGLIDWFFDSSHFKKCKVVSVSFFF